VSTTERPWRPSHSDMRTSTFTLPLTVSTAGASGPWSSFDAVIEGEQPLAYSIAAPWFLDNGTAFWVLQSDCPEWVCSVEDRASSPPSSSSSSSSSFSSSPSCPGTCGTIIRGETWEGPYRIVGRGACQLGEDHSMWIDKRGFHCVTHKFSNASLPPGPYDASRDGGHSFSLDGSDRSWFCADGRGGHETCHVGSPPAYNSTIIEQDDSGINRVNRYGTRERPHVLFDDNGLPVALTTSVQHCQLPSVPDECVPGDSHSCNNSNLLCHNGWPGYMDRAWTAVTPLRTTKP
jgi:hypothetical protein